MKALKYLPIFILMSCNNQLMLTSEDPAKIEVVAPSQMRLGDCTAWGVRLLSVNLRSAMAKEDTTLSLAVTSGGASVAGADLYSDSSCTQTLTALQIQKNNSSAAIYMKYNLVASLTLTASSASLTAGAASVTTSLEWNRVTKIAGAGECWGNVEGVGSEARIPPFKGIATDGLSVYGTHDFTFQVYRFEIATRRFSIFAGAATTTGTTDAVGTAARFKLPTGLAILNGYLYVADKNSHTIRRINLSTQAVTTVAGLAGTAAHTDGVGSAARFSSPHGLTTDGTYLYITSDTHTIRKLDPSNFAVTTLAGVGGTSGTANGIGTAAKFNKPGHLTTDGTYLYIPDTNNHTIRMLELATNTVTTLAGTAGATGSTNGVGAAARFSSPTSVAYEASALYVGDLNNQVVRKIVLGSAQVTTHIGAVGAIEDYADGTFTAARLGTVYNLAVQSSKLYVADSNCVVRQADLVSETTETLGGVSASNAWTVRDGVGLETRFSWIDQIAADGSYLYIAGGGNVIRRMNIATRLVETIVGTADVTGSADGIGPAASFNNPTGMALGGGYLYVSDMDNFTIRKINLSTMQVTTLAGSAGVSATTDGVGAAARFKGPGGLILLGNDLYVGDWRSRVVRKVDVTTGAVTTIAGTAGVIGTIDGIGTAAQFNEPYSLTYLNGYIYLTDYRAHTIRKINLATNEVTTVAGIANSYGYVDGIGTAAKFWFPWTITNDGTYLYVTDSNGSAIRKINPQTDEVTTYAGKGPTIIGDRDSSLASSTTAWPTAIVYTTSGFFFANDGVGISWIH